MAVATDADVAAAVGFNRVAATSRVSSAAVSSVAVAVAFEAAGYKGGQAGQLQVFGGDA